MMPVGPRSNAGASLSVAVPASLPQHLRNQVREIARVRASIPGNGHASALLAETCREADATRTNLMLAVEPDGDAGLNRQALLDWYARAGFAPFQAEPLLMVRTHG